MQEKKSGHEIVTFLLPCMSKRWHKAFDGWVKIEREKIDRLCVLYRMKKEQFDETIRLTDPTTFLSKTECGTLYLKNNHNVEVCQKFREPTMQSSG